MVSLRCKMIVKAELEALGLHHGAVELGEVKNKENITDGQRDQLKTALLKSGLELMDDKRAVLIEKIKAVIVEMIHYEEELPKNKIFRLYQQETEPGLQFSFASVFRSDGHYS